MQQSEQSQQQNLFSQNNQASTDLFGNVQAPIDNNKQQQAQEEDSKETKQALCNKREQFRIDMRKKLTDQKLQLKRQKFFKQTDERIVYDQQQCDQEVNNLLQFSVDTDLDKIIKQLQKINQMSINEEACQFFSQNTQLLQYLLDSLNIFNTGNQQKVNELSQIIQQSAWTLANLAYYSTFPYNNQQFIKLLIERLFGTLGIQNIAVISLGLHAISNIITENDFTRSYCLELGIIDIIKASLDKKQFNMEILITVSQIVNGLVNVKPCLNDEIQQQDDDILYNSLECLKQMICEYNNRNLVKKIANSQQAMNFILGLMDTCSGLSLVQLKLIKIFIQFTSLDNTLINSQMINAGVLNLIKMGMESTSSEMRNFSAILLSNIAYGEQWQEVISDETIINQSLNKLSSETFTIKREYLIFFKCLLSRAKHEHVKSLLDKNILLIFKRILTENDPQAIITCIECLSMLWNYGEDTMADHSGENIVLKKAEQYNIPNIIVDLQEHQSEEVFKSVSKFLLAHFECE